MKVNFIIAAAIIFLLCNNSFAQQNKNKKDKEYNWGVGAAINSVEAQIGKPEEVSWNYSSTYNTNASTKTDKSFSLSIIPKYYINKNVLLRFEFCITHFETAFIFNTKNVLPPVTNYTINNATSEQRKFKYVPGIQLNIFNRTNFEAFCGITISYSKYNRLTSYSKNETWNTANDTLFSTSITNGTTPGGFTTGIGALVGFNFYLQKHVSIGVEFSTAYLYYDLGGVSSGEINYQKVSKDPTVTEYRYADSSYEGFQFSKILSSFNIGFRF